MTIDHFIGFEKEPIIVSMIHWCTDTFGPYGEIGCWGWYWYDNQTGVFSFDHEKDSMLFVLRWL